MKSGRWLKKTAPKQGEVWKHQTPLRGGLFSFFLILECVKSSTTSTWLLETLNLQTGEIDLRYVLNGQYNRWEKVA